MEVRLRQGHVSHFVETLVPFQASRRGKVVKREEGNYFYSALVKVFIKGEIPEPHDDAHCVDFFAEELQCLDLPHEASAAVQGVINENNFLVVWSALHYALEAVALSRNSHVEPIYVCAVCFCL